MEQEAKPTEEENPSLGPGDALMAGTLIGTHTLEHVYGRAFLVLIPKIFDSLGLTNFQAGLLDAIRQLAGGLTSMGGGLYVDMFQHLRGQILAFSMALIGVGYLLVAVSPTYALILAALVFPAAGTALWHPPALGLLSQRFPQRRGLLMSLHRSTGNIGDWLGPLIVGVLLGVLGWRWLMGGGTPLLILLAVLLLVLLRDVGGPKPSSVAFGSNLMYLLRSMKEAFRYGGMWPIFIVSALRGMGDRSLLWIIPLYLSKDLDKSDPVVGLHVALLAVPGIISGLAFGAMSDRIGRKAIIVLVMGVGVILPVTMVLGGGGIWMTLSVAAFGFTLFSVNSLTQAAAIDVVEGKRLEGTFIGLMWGSNAFFGALASVAAGALADLSGRKSAFYFASALYILGFLASLVMPSTGSRVTRASGRPSPS